MKLAYYAHPITEYGTLEETHAVKAIEHAGFVVINPNCPAIDLEYKLAKARGIDSPMFHVFHPIVQRCDVVFFRAFPDGKISSGVAMEVGWADSLGKPVFELPTQRVERTLTYQQTLERLK